MNEYYKIVNEKLNNFALNTHKGFFYHNLNEFYRLSILFVEKIDKNFDLIEMNKLNLSSKIELDGVASLEIVKEFIKQIDPKLNTLFNKLLREGIFNFVDEKDDNIYDEKSSYSGFNIINVGLEHNYEDPSTIIHEFFHQINYPPDKYPKEARYMLGEMISIYFEDKILDYMEKCGYDKEELSKIKTYRMHNTYSVAKKLTKYLPIFIIFEETGNISETTYNFIEENFSSFPYTREEFDELIQEMGERFRQNKTINPMHFSKYLFGDNIAKYLEMNSKFEDTTKKLLKLNEQINDITIKEALNIVDININQMDVSLECVNSYDQYIKKNFGELESFKTTIK